MNMLFSDRVDGVVLMRNPELTKLIPALQSDKLKLTILQDLPSMKIGLYLSHNSAHLESLTKQMRKAKLSCVSQQVSN